MNPLGSLLKGLFAGASAKNAAALRAYGKLPFYAEYRRLELAPGTATAYSRWLDDGRLAWARNSPDGRLGAMRAMRLLLRPPGSKEWVVACLWDSRDSLGRIFPFSFFVVAPADGLGRDLLQRFTAAGLLQTELDRGYSELGRLSGGGDFYAAFGKQSLPLRPDDLAARAEHLLTRAAALSCQDWRDALELSEADAAAWLERLRRRVTNWRANPGALDDVALALPLARGVSFDEQAAVWLAWLQPFLRKDAALLWSAGTGLGAGRLFVVTRELLLEDFQLLTTDAGHYVYLDDLTATPTPTTVATAAAESAAAEDNAAASDPPALPADSLLQVLRSL